MKSILFFLLFSANLIIAMDMEEQKDQIAIFLSTVPSSLDLYDEIIDYQCPDPDVVKEQEYWQRLKFLSQINNLPAQSPFSREQQEEFDAALAKHKRDYSILVAGIIFGVTVQGLGFLTFLGLLGNGSLGTILTSAILPTAGLASIAFGLWSTGYEPRAEVFKGLMLTLHQKVDRELERLALFLIRKSFSDNDVDRKNAAEIVQTMDVEKLRKIYAEHSQTPAENLAILFEELDEAITYLKEHKILGNSQVVAREIRLCILEKKICYFVNESKQVIIKKD